MKISKRINMTLAAALLACSGVAQADISYSTVDTPVLTVPSLVDYSTTGANMTGLSVTAVFANGLTETLNWLTTDATTGSGGVFSANGWSLSLTGDSFSYAWDFAFTSPASALTLTQLVFDGQSVYTVFDRTFSNTVGTAGSALGQDFALLVDVDATVKYSNQVALANASAVGDVWYGLSVDFGSGIDSNFSFVLDTDNVSRSVPEPAMLGLLGLAFAGAGFSLRRRKAA